MPTHNAEHDERLDEILASYLEAAQVGKAPPLQHLIDKHPDLAPELESFLADEQRLYCLTKPLRVVFTSKYTHDAGQLVGDYEIIEELAHGGMGVVYKARQKSLNRIVALKMLRSGIFAGDAERQRFRSEAEAVAGLDHPNIIPIYEVGEHENQPYFSMKMLSGGSLAKNRAAFADKPREIARLLATIARAIHHAHEHGILHRDLKPANILLQSANTPAETSPGEQPATWNVQATIPFVSDFGLAKRQPKPDQPAPDAALTQTGAILGTPSYMAPEQALGGKGAITTAVDVYGLGAILYEMLTGRAPFRGETLLETLRALMETEPIRPRTLNPRAHRDLEIICLKCLEKDPVRRYASALALAEDLDRFVAGEPIQARPVGQAEWVWRWCRRKPVPAALLAALFLSITVGFGLVAWQWRRAEVNAEGLQTSLLALQQEQDRTKQEKQKAEANLRKLQALVDRICTRIADKELLHIPGTQPVRKQLLEEAMAYYKEFLAEWGDDPAIELELARTQARLAFITSEMGVKAEALTLYEQALVTFEKFLVIRPGDQDLKALVAGTYNSVSLLLDSLGNKAGALARLQKARVLQEELFAQNPKSEDYVNVLAMVYNNLAHHQSDAGKVSEALASYHRSRQLREDIIESGSTNPEQYRKLAVTYGNIGNIYKDNGKPAESLAAYEKSLELREGLCKAFPNIPHMQCELAASYRGLGSWYRDQDKPDEAVKYLEKALATLKPVATASPSVTIFQQDLASTHQSLALLQRKRGQTAEALASYQSVRVIQEKLARLYSPVSPFQNDLAHTYFNIALQQGDLDQLDEAIATYQLARKIEERLVAANPDKNSYRDDLGITLLNLGLHHMTKKQYKEAIPIFQEALEHQRVLFTRAPQLAHYRKHLSDTYINLAECIRKQGRVAESVALTLERQKLWPDNGQQLYIVAREMCFSANQLRRSKPELSPQDEERHRRYEDQAVAALRQAVVAGGYKNREKLETDSAFDKIRGREDFQQMLSTVPQK